MLRSCAVATATIWIAIAALVSRILDSLTVTDYRPLLDAAGAAVQSGSAGDYFYPITYSVTTYAPGSWQLAALFLVLLLIVAATVATRFIWRDAGREEASVGAASIAFPRFGGKQKRDEKAQRERVRQIVNPLDAENLAALERWQQGEALLVANDPDENTDYRFYSGRH